MSAKISDNHTFMQQQTQRHRRLAAGRRSAAATAALPRLSLGLVGVAASAFCAPASAADAIASAWSPPVEAYRSMLVAFSGSLAKGVDVPAWAATTRALRQWMIANDPDYPIYHLAAPEGWNNDPNGVTYDPQGDGLYHRFYQYDKTYSDNCMHGNIKNCTVDGKKILNPASRVWGHTVSRDGATWEDWPGIDADDPESDAPGVYSGNCALRDDGKPVCIYSNGHCSIGVCAYSADWIHWNKTACMTRAPSARSQTNHDSSIWRDGPGGTWYMLSGGCTYGGSNRPSNTFKECSGTGQLWNSTDLVHFEYMHAITPGGPGAYWELPYLLPFNQDGSAIDNYHHNDAPVYALLFGHGNAYYVGKYSDQRKEFVPLGAKPVPPPSPAPPSPPAGMLLAAWPLANASGVNTVSGVPAASIAGARASGVGTVFYLASTMTIPYFANLAQPTGFTVSFMVQLNSPKGGNHNSKLLSKEDDSWGVEWWGGSLLNFYVRGPGASAGTQGTEFRAIQGRICSSSSCEASWVRVAMSYSGTSGFASNIQMFAGGKPVVGKASEPGTWHGPAAATTGSGLVTEGLAEIVLADVQFFSGAMSAVQLRALTAKPVPAPAPKPLPAPHTAPPRPPPPPSRGNGGAPAGWPAQNMSGACHQLCPYQYLLAR
eukprot:SAG31_NODE_4896_length_2879_cov_2.297842_1_plen_657_part_00